MHIPPYHRKKTWQRFFFGVFTGGVIAYLVLLYMYGSMYEELLRENIQLNETVTDLRNQNEALLSDHSDKDTPTIQTIEVRVINEEEVNDSLLLSQLITLVKGEVEHLIGVDTNIVSESEDLLRAAIENKNFKIEDISYQFTITSLTISTKLRIKLEVDVLD